MAHADRGSGLPLVLARVPLHHAMWNAQLERFLAAIGSSLPICGIRRKRGD